MTPTGRTLKGTNEESYVPCGYSSWVEKSTISSEDGFCCIVTKYCLSFRIESSPGDDYAGRGALCESLYLLLLLANQCGADLCFVHKDNATAEGSSVQTV